jgi:hypothetical protein
MLSEERRIQDALGGLAVAPRRPSISPNQESKMLCLGDKAFLTLCLGDRAFATPVPRGQAFATLCLGDMCSTRCGNPVPQL